MHGFRRRIASFPWFAGLRWSFVGYVAGTLLAAGAAGIYLSGAGPTLMCVYLDEEVPARIEKLIAGLRNDWRVLPLEVDREGARTEVLE